jgi:hypothetical protein
MDTSKSDSVIFEKSQSPLRWIVLLLGCVMMIANYYCYDNPAALKTQVSGIVEVGFCLFVTIPDLD